MSAADKKKIGLPSRRRMRHDRHFVDELTQRMGEGIGRMVRLEDIASSQDQPRTSIGDLEDLVGSVSKHGVLEPLLVRRSSNGRTYELVSGERRFRAAQQAGLTEVPCIELEVGDDVALEIALVENLQRQDLTPFEEGEGYRTLIEKYGYTHEQVAQAVGRSRVTVTESLKLLAIPEPIQSLCRHADITAKGVLLEIARLETEQAMAELVQEIVEQRLDRDAIRQRRQELSGTTETPSAEAPEDGGETTSPSPSPRAPRPFVVRFKPANRNFTVALSFRTDDEPDTPAVIAALEELLAELRSGTSSGS